MTTPNQKPERKRKELAPLASELVIHVSDEVLGQRLAKLLTPEKPVQDRKAA